MVEALFILAFGLVFFVAMVVLVAWLGVQVVRLCWAGVMAFAKYVWREISGEITPTSRVPQLPHEQISQRAYHGRCRNAHCGASLPRGARFCIRCGSSTMSIAREVA